MSTTNKAIVSKFNHEVIERCNRDAFEALVAEDFVNHTAGAGQPTGREGLWHTFQNVLHPGLSDLKVVVLDQVAEQDKVTTRKRITGRHSGELLGIPATGRLISIDVIDIVRIQDGRYVEHWGINSLASVLADLRSA
ncbi:ester cyclase [Pseudomonas gingeri NCPPB 3146 = LMG 5327]|uniref:Ester cyclase n=2 Tax=Pseudomonas gingeri TaxID=117681 RepID=A0A7Y7Y2I8_9PSED|nr:ester cyclase [Pseudomonas gingeri]NWC16534.1 ester cyclase [Pseudomonas gingeri]PNQ88305.1 ester cyclase [Pseudomonas gingeri NCPPB 3146 = LMG 5327]